MNSNAAQASIDRVVAEIERMGSKAHLSRGQFRTVIGAVGEEGFVDQTHLAALDGVEKVVPIMKPYKLASREFHEDDSVIEVGGGSTPTVKIGGSHAACIAGPCAVESEAILNRIARHVRDGGATILRGGVYKPRTSPYSFQGLGGEALRWMRACGDELGMPICVEVMDTRQVEQMEKFVDCFQIGARNMQNFDLLREVGKTTKPVLLKRGLSASVKEWLMSAEYVLSQGNRGVILCERGIKTFEDSIRYSLDITSIPVAKQWSHLPMIVDPSHAAGKRDWVGSLALAGMAAGAHGVIVEVHYNPAEAQCDGPQALLPETFKALMEQLRQIAAITEKEFSVPADLALASN
ncbi:MAG TPA: 3-deoxy-7-phosphoheptulonate synthase [Tepidisphaeraceae bacterium]|jgi:3-deoxy-7-phosphoheptulonate synthase|nr:3-deoxy-7-phosphoheptulonate synthase [Tepidisphaeraceae bacterium]